MHKYLVYNDETDDTILNKLVIATLNYYTQKNINSKKKWRKEGSFRLRFPNNPNKVSSSIGFDILANHFKNENGFNPHSFKLPMMWCGWLDYSVKSSFDLKEVPLVLDLKNVFGEKDKNTWIFNEPTIFIPSFGNALSKHIINKRHELVGNSHLMLHQTWLLDLRNLICDTISALDITFNRIHYKAEFDKPAEWNFDKEKLGERNQNLMRKFKWIKPITKQDIPDIAKEKESLNRLRMLRNQLVHFDPPYIEIKLNDMEIIFNDMIEVFKLIYKVRSCANIPVSIFLINLILQKKVVYVENTESAVNFAI